MFNNFSSIILRSILSDFWESVGIPQEAVHNWCFDWSWPLALEDGFDVCSVFLELSALDKVPHSLFVSIVNTILNSHRMSGRCLV